jgi:hypothetical protein
MNPNDLNELFLNLFGLTISAKGIVAICAIAIPVALLLMALAWRIAGGDLGAAKRHTPIPPPYTSVRKYLTDDPPLHPP